MENIGESEFAGKKIFGLSELRVGAFTDAHSRLDRYWFCAGLRKAATYVFGYTSAAKHIMWRVCSDLQLAKGRFHHTGMYVT